MYTGKVHVGTIDEAAPSTYRIRGPIITPLRVEIMHIFYTFFIHSRTDESKKTRLHVGGGIRLELVGEGDLYLECLLSENYSDFVQSFYLDAINNHKFNLTGSTAHKFRSGANTKVIF